MHSVSNLWSLNHWKLLEVFMEQVTGAALNGRHRMLELMSKDVNSVCSDNVKSWCPLLPPRLGASGTYFLESLIQRGLFS